MNINTNISQRQIDSTQRGIEEYRRRYVIESADWEIEGTSISAQVVPLTHPTLAFRTEEDEYHSPKITAPELYGILRRQSIEHVLLAHTDPIVGCICMWNIDSPFIEEVYSEEFYFVIEYSELNRFLNFFLDNSTQSEKANWIKEGF